MSFKPDHPPAGPSPVGVRLMVDFSTGRIIGVERPAPPAPGQPRPGYEPPSRDAA
jgi:hypothetical protein